MKQLVFSDLINVYNVQEWIQLKIDGNEGYSIKVPPVMISSGYQFVIITLILDLNA